MTRRSGNNGWQTWEVHEKKWEALAKKRLGHAVTFVPWTAFELRAMLDASQMAGLRAHWFGELCLTPEWLSRRIDSAVVDLDHRYHAEDHVHVGIEQPFEVIVRSNKVREYFGHRLTELQKDANRWLGEAPGMLVAQLPDATRHFPAACDRSQWRAFPDGARGGAKVSVAPHRAAQKMPRGASPGFLAAPQIASAFTRSSTMRSKSAALGQPANGVLDRLY